MKKTAALLLAIVLLVSLAVTAFAATTSVHAPVSSPEKTADKPVVESGDVVFKTADELPEEEKAEYEEALASLKEVVPEEMTVQYFNKVYAPKYPASVVLRIDNAETVSAKLLADGEWFDVAVVAGNDHRFSLEIGRGGYLAVFTK